MAIGRAFVKHADVLLFDERLSNLDAKLRTELRREITRLHETLNPTVVYVTHDRIEAMTMATKIAVVNDGEIQRCDTPDEVYEHPEPLCVAGFIGALAMTLMTARVAVEAGRPQARFADATRVDLTACSLETTPIDGIEIAVGMPPQHFVMDASAARAGHTLFELSVFGLSVRRAERTGSDALISLEFANDQLFVRAAPDRAAKTKLGDTVPVHYPTAELNVFDA